MNQLRSILDIFGSGVENTVDMLLIDHLGENQIGIEPIDINSVIFLRSIVYRRLFRFRYQNTTVNADLRLRGLNVPCHALMILGRQSINSHFRLLIKEAELMAFKNRASKNWQKLVKKRIRKVEENHDNLL